MVAILGKLGLKSADPGAASLIRSVAMSATLIVFAVGAGSASKIPAFSTRSWVCLGLSGVAGALSWIFYFRALSVADTTRVAAIDKLSVPIVAILALMFLGERLTTANWAGVALMAVGAYLVTIGR
ncbi:MAG: EamA family transporter [Phycisphaerales bacterium]|nr:EamA family transporter [Phycisphaerales bacterium]